MNKYYLLTSKIARNKIPVHSNSYSRSFFTFLSSYVQDSICSFHSLTGVPWWASIVSSSFIIRIATLPLLKWQIDSSSKFKNASQDLQNLNYSLRKRINQIYEKSQNEKKNSVVNSYMLSRSFPDIINALSSYTKGVKACFILHDISLAPIIIPPSVNIFVFATFTYSVRLMLFGDLSSEFENGGIFWFDNLTRKDSTFLLPVISLGLSYQSLQLSMNTPSISFIAKLKDFFQSILILAFPFILHAPSGIFCYWIPFSFFRIAQIYIMKNDNIKKFLKL